MSKLVKRIEKMIAQPNGIRFSEVCYVLKSIGCEVYEGGKGSHVLFFQTETNIRITVPRHKPVKAQYIKEVIKIFHLEDYLHEDD